MREEERRGDFWRINVKTNGTITIFCECFWVIQIEHGILIIIIILLYLHFVSGSVC